MKVVYFKSYVALKGDVDVKPVAPIIHSTSNSITATDNVNREDSPDHSQTLLFLKALDIPTNHKQRIQYYVDKKIVQGQDAKYKKMTTHRMVNIGDEEVFLDNVKINMFGLGVHLTINPTDGSGRKASNITGIRAFWADLDGAPIEPVQNFEYPPHVIVESSPGRWHCYWLIDDMPIGDNRELQVIFKRIQSKIIQVFNADPQVKTIERVMRLPGFLHNKKKPFMTRLEYPVTTDEIEERRYDLSFNDFESALDAGLIDAHESGSDIDFSEINDFDYSSISMSGAVLLKHPYMKASMKNACEAIRNARPAGSGSSGKGQEQTLFEQSRSIAQLLAAYVKKNDGAVKTVIDELVAAGMEMENEFGRDPWTEVQIREKITHTFEWGMGHPRRNAPDLKTGESLDPVLALNADHAFIKVGGKSAIMQFNSPYEMKELRKPSYELLDKTSFMDEYANKFVGFTNRGMPITAAKAWFIHSDRREYKGVIFEPEKNFDDYYNIFQGFMVAPDENASWKRMEAHVREVLCNGNEDHYNFLMTWLAHLFQFPGQKMSCGVVLRGGKGIGKSLFAEWITSLMFPYAMKVSSGKHIVGRFNAHMSGKLLMVSEEAFFAGDKSHEGALKDLISSDTIAIEKKFKDIVEISNYLRLMFISNEDFVVPASIKGERRFLVLDVSDHKRGQIKEYFKPLAQEKYNGGLEGLMHTLMTWVPPYDEGWDILRTPPVTAGLIDQALESMKVWDRFFFNLITTGRDLRGDRGLNDGHDIELNINEANSIPTKELRANFDIALQKKGDYEAKLKIGNGTFFGKRVKEWFFADKKQIDGVWHYIIPPLTELKEKTEERIEFSLGEITEWTDTQSQGKKEMLDL